MSSINSNLNYNSPNLDSSGDTYIAGESIPSNNASNQPGSLSFTEIRNRLLANLQKEYNYLYPRYLDAYKRWKSNTLDQNSIDAQSAQSDYQNLEQQLSAINNALSNLNQKTNNSIYDTSNTVYNQDKQIFLNQKKIQDEKNNINELNERLSSDNDKIKDYQILNRNWSHRLLFWIIITIIVAIVWLVMMSKFYGFKTPGKQE